MGNQVLKGVSFELHAGECLALVGENGAGKSTLMKIISGIYTKDAGAILIDGKPANPGNPKEAQRLGISIIHQELNLIPNLTVAQNIYLGRETAWHGIINDKEMNRHVREILNEMQVDIDPTSPVAAYTVAEQQIVEIARVLSQNARIIIMDEPTAALSLEETQRLFAIIEKLKKDGKGIIYISHRLEEIYRVAERICVLRDGHLVDVLSTQTPVKEVVEAMVGQSIENFYPKQKFPPGEVLLEVQNISDGKNFFDISFTVRSGEVYGLSGLLGAGQTQIARALYGLGHIESGEIFLNGRPYKHPSPHKSIQSGLGMITEDRKLEGLVQRMSIRENMMLSPFSPAHNGLGIIQKGKEHALAEENQQRYGIKAESIHQEVILLSGGNQQKVVFARTLATAPDVIIMCEPTRGVDVNGKVEIYRIINLLLAQRKAIILVSSEIPEALGMSDRIAILYKGRMVKELINNDLNQEEIMFYATGGHAHG